ncbi:hypothetical protein [Subtercola vilae]|uniref:Uncharacterized protein n=1 Tax=Subtercola vilae TaxID=2056433 RepID=A0A4T2BUV9_9MICO|nr:hypothetical protein [Subtercola vilae]TIH35563.1 hypothetical protein D4765_10890 [Subtercola vilae]
MTSRAARVLRGLISAGVSVFVAALSHVAAGGMAPGTVGLALALAVSSLVCVALAGKRLSLPRLALSVAFSQVALHLLFTVGAGSAALSPSEPMTGEMAGMSHGSALVSMLFDQSAAGAASIGAGSAMQPCSWMWLAHAVAALVTIVALRRGELAFWGLYNSAALRVRRFRQLVFVEPATPDARAVPHGTRAPDHPLDLGVFLGSLRHRGPPVWQHVSA